MAAASLARPAAARVRRALAAFAIVVIAVVGWATSASAHAILEGSSPADRSHLDTPPAAVSLTFSENVRAPLGAVKVFDSNGKRVDNGNVTVGANTVSLGLDHIGDGGYVVTWRVFSADSHPVSGAFTFSVGSGQAPTDAAVAGVFDKGGDKPYQIGAAVDRWFMYGGVFLAAGGALFVALVHDGEPADRRWLRRIVVVGGTLGVAGVLGAIVFQAALATGLGLTAITKSGVLGDALADGIGLSSVLVIVGAAVAMASTFGRRTALTRAEAIGGGALATGAFALAGHTTETSPKWLAMLTDVTHVWAAAAWFGIVLLAVVLWRRRDDDPLVVGHMVARFSRMATLVVVVVAVAGGVLAYEEVRAARALTSTTYGWVLIAKIAAVAVVAAIGTYNHLRLLPALESAPRAATRLLRRTVRAEAFVMLAVVALAAVLVNVTPARTAAGITGIYSDTEPLGNGSVNLVVDPARAGANSVHLYVLDAAGRNVDVMSIELDASLPSSGIAAITLTPFAAGPGHYQVDGAPLTIAGDWTIEVKARVSKFEEETATFTVTVHT